MSIRTSLSGKSFPEMGTFIDAMEEGVRAEIDTKIAPLEAKIASIEAKIGSLESNISQLQTAASAPPPPSSGETQLGTGLPTDSIVTSSRFPSSPPPLPEELSATDTVLVSFNYTLDDRTVETSAEFTYLDARISSEGRSYTRRFSMNDSGAVGMLVEKGKLVTFDGIESAFTADSTGVITVYAASAEFGVIQLTEEAVIRQGTIGYFWENSAGEILQSNPNTGPLPSPFTFIAPTTDATYTLRIRRPRF
jgi:hypothetical protein